MARPVLVYSLLRVVLFVGGYGLALLVGLDGALALLGGLIVSASASALLLRRQRDAIAEAAVQRRAAATADRERLRARLDESDTP